MICIKCNNMMRYNNNNHNGGYFSCSCGNTKTTGYNPHAPKTVASIRATYSDKDIDLIAERGRD